jgi:NAD+ kinase
LGFLTEIAADTLFLTLQSVLDGTAELDDRKLLSVELLRGNNQAVKTFAMNDVVITKEAIARIFSLEFSVDGEAAATIRGDGVIVSTPSGSTAYSLAAGGSIVHPRVEAILLTPICPHSLTLRPLILPGTSKIVLEVSRANKFNGNEVYLTVDGQEGCALHAGDRVVITGSEYLVKIVRPQQVTYFDVLANKLKWAHQ